MLREIIGLPPTAQKLTELTLSIDKSCVFLQSPCYGLNCVSPKIHILKPYKKGYKMSL